MSELSDLRAAYEMANARALRTETQLENERTERESFAAVAARVHEAETAKAAAERLVSVLTSTEDPLSPMAVLAVVSEERSSVKAERDDLRKQLEVALARIAELEKRFGADPKEVDLREVAAQIDFAIF